MIVYYRAMRTKDDNKRRAISEAAINLIYKVGFAETSMAKIAKEAGVSSSTIYVYFNNKEDMLNKLYVYCKSRIFESVFESIDFDLPVYEILKQAFYNFYNVMITRPVLFFFSEQFANSPFINRLTKEQVTFQYDKIIQVINRGIKEKILVDTHYYIILMQLFSPILMLVKHSNEQGDRLEKKWVDDTFKLSWKAVKA